MVKKNLFSEQIMLLRRNTSRKIRQETRTVEEEKQNLF